MSTAYLFFVGVIDLFVTQFSFQWLRFGFECPVGSFYTQEQTWLADPNRKEIYNCETEIHISFVRSIIHPHLFFLLHQETDCCVRSGCCRCRCYFLRHIRNVLPVQQNIEWICFISPLWLTLLLLLLLPGDNNMVWQERGGREIIETRPGRRSIWLA